MSLWQTPCMVSRGGRGRRPDHDSTDLISISHLWCNFHWVRLDEIALPLSLKKRRGNETETNTKENNTLHSEDCSHRQSQP